MSIAAICGPNSLSAILIGGAGLFSITSIGASYFIESSPKNTFELGLAAATLLLKPAIGFDATVVKEIYDSKDARSNGK